MAQGIATIDHLDGYMAALLPANFDRSGGYGGFFDVLLAGQVDESRLPDLVAATAASRHLERTDAIADRAVDQ